MLRLAVPLLLGLITANCSSRGKFAFAVADHTNLSVLEQHFYTPQRFERPQVKPIFESDDVLWFAYRPHSVRENEFYAVSLTKKNLGYQEIDLRNRTIATGVGHLIDHYTNLEEGEYRLRIAHNNKVIDQIDFVIVGDSASESIDYDRDEPEV